MNLEMRAALVQHGHPNDFEVHEGLHAGSYWDPHIRRQLGFVRSIEVDLGPSGPTDEHAGASGVPGAGRTARISLSYDA